MRWTKRNPISAGLVTFIPVLATAGVMKIARGVGKGLGIVNKGYGKDGLLKGTGKAEDGKEEAKSFGHGLDESIGFGGAKKDAGPLEGILKTVQGWV